MRFYPSGWEDYLSGGLYYLQQDSSLVFSSDRGPYNGEGSWDASEVFNGTYDIWGNLTVDGTWSEEWHDSFFSPPENPDNHYTSSISVSAEGCLAGSESGYKDTVSERSRYDCPVGAGCTYHAPVVGADSIDESDACTPSSGPGASWTFERHLALSDAVTAEMMITAIDSLLPDLATLPWGAAQAGVSRRFDPPVDCGAPGGWEDPVVLSDELTALQAIADAASEDVGPAAEALSEAEDALSDYLAEWEVKHALWRDESVLRCNEEGTMEEADWLALDGFIQSRISDQQSLEAAVAYAQRNVEDVQEAVDVAEFHVAQKSAQVSGYVPGNYAGYMEADVAGAGVEMTDIGYWPLWVEKGRAEARLRIQRDSPSRAQASGGELYEVKVGTLHTFTVEIPAGDYFAYTEAYTYDAAAADAEITITNITPPPV